MASNVLPQALCMIPRRRVSCNRSTLGFSTPVLRQPPLLTSARISNSRVSNYGFVSNPNTLVAKLRNMTFVARVEGNSEGEAEASEAGEVEAAEVESTAEAGAEAEAEGDGEVEAKPPRKPRVKLGDIMGILHKRAVEASQNERPIPDLRTGDVVEIKLEVPENRRRLSTYKGIVISKQNAGIHTTIRIRRIIAGVGVEIVFPVYSPNIKEIRVLSHRKVRRARLYYLRDKLPRLSTFK